MGNLCSKTDINAIFKSPGIAYIFDVKIMSRIWIIKQIALEMVS